MTLRERASRAGLEVALKTQGGGLVGKFNRDVKAPQTVTAGVGGQTLVACRETSGNIGRDADVVTRWRFGVSQYIQAAECACSGSSCDRGIRRPAFASRRRGILRASLTRWVYRAEARRRRAKDGGPDRDRTGDLMNAIHARSQLRYWPTWDVPELPIIDGKTSPMKRRILCAEPLLPARVVHPCNRLTSCTCPA